MNYSIFDGLTRRAALLTLGAVGLAGLGGSTATEAENRHRNRKKCDVKKLCKRQKGQCIDSFAAICQGESECEAIVEFCCSAFGNCDPAGFFDCITPP